MFMFAFDTVYHEINLAHAISFEALSFPQVNRRLSTIRSANIATKMSTRLISRNAFTGKFQLFGLKD